MNTIDCLFASTGEFSERLGDVLQTFVDELLEFIRCTGDLHFVHGSFGCDSSVQCLVPGSDVDAVIFSSKSFDETMQSIMSFCIENGWGNKTYDRNLVTLFPRVESSLLKIDLLLVKNTPDVKYMPCALSTMGGEYMVFESLRGPIKGDIDISQDACNKVYHMTQTIKESQIGTAAHLFIKTVIKAYGINMPSVAVTCAMVGSISRLNSSTKQEDHDSKYLFSNALKNCVNILKAIGVETRSTMPTSPYVDVIEGCYNGHRDPYFEIITPFQGMIVNENVGLLGDVLCKLHILDAGLMGLYTDAKSQNGTLNIALLACALRHADAETLDPTTIKEMFSNPLRSDLLDKSIKDKINFIQRKLIEKDAHKATHKTIAANTARDEAHKATNEILQKNFSDIHFPAVSSREVGGTMFFNVSQNVVVESDN